MNGNGIALRWRLVIAASVAALAAGCTGQPPVKSGEGVTVARLERSAWNAPPEPGLFRMTFDAKRIREIRRESEHSQAPEGLDPETSFLHLLVQDAGRELEARGLCKGNARVVTFLDEGDGGAGASAILKCHGPLF